MIVAGGGVGGLFLAKALQKQGIKVTILEKTGKFARFGGPIQVNPPSCADSLCLPPFFPSLPPLSPSLPTHAGRYAVQFCSVGVCKRQARNECLDISFCVVLQLASNALSTIKAIDEDMFAKLMKKFTFTGTRTNGIKDGIRTQWYTKFDAITKMAEYFKLPYTGVIDRPDLQELLLDEGSSLFFTFSSSFWLLACAAKLSRSCGSWRR